MHDGSHIFVNGESWRAAGRDAIVLREGANGGQRGEDRDEEGTVPERRAHVRAAGQGQARRRSDDAEWD